MEKTKTVTESDVAFATFDVKSEKRFYNGDIERTRKSEIDGDQNLNSCFDISAAYVYDVNNIQSILENERRKYGNDPKSYPKRKILGNSVENIISPLNQLSRNPSIKLTDLFHEIQSVRENDVLVSSFANNRINIDINNYYIGFFHSVLIVCFIVKLIGELNIQKNILWKMLMIKYKLSV